MSSNFKILLFFLISILVVELGCGKKEAVQLPKKEELSKKEQLERQKEEEKELYKNSSILNEMKVVNLYFIDNIQPKLSIEKREVLNLPDKQQMLKQVLSTLTYGPLSKLIPSIPSNFSISSVFIVGKTAYVDIKKDESNAINVGGIESEELFLYSIVNTTLALNEELENVKILLNGEESETLLGHISTSGLFQFNESIVKN